MVGLIDDGHLQRKLRLSRIQTRPGKELGQVESEFVGAILVSLAHQVNHHGALNIPYTADDVHLCVHHRLSEEVVSLHNAFHAIGRHTDPEFGQSVGSHIHGLLGADVAKGYAEIVAALIHHVGQDKVGGGNAELGVFDALAIHLVSPGILHEEIDRLAARGCEVKRAQGERSHVDRLAGLVDGLVA